LGLGRIKGIFRNSNFTHGVVFNSKFHCRPA
jgi:hypothetical protein